MKELYSFVFGMYKTKIKECSKVYSMMHKKIQKMCMDVTDVEAQQDRYFLSCLSDEPLQMQIGGVI